MKFVIDRDAKFDSISGPQMDLFLSQQLGISGIKTGATAQYIIVEHDELTNEDFDAIKVAIDSYVFDPEFGKDTTKSLEQRITAIEQRLAILETKSGNELSSSRK